MITTRPCRRYHPRLLQRFGADAARHGTTMADLAETLVALPRDRRYRRVSRAGQRELRERWTRIASRRGQNLPTLLSHIGILDRRPSARRLDVSEAEVGRRLRAIREAVRSGGHPDFRG